MAGRPKHYNDEELIDRAIGVFWSKGYTAASAQDLLRAMNIGQGSFYRTFPGGKKELYLKSINQHLGNTVQRFNTQLEQSENPIQYLNDFFISLANRPTKAIENGCYFGNSIVELSHLDEEAKLLAASKLDKMKVGIEKVLTKLKLDGNLKTTEAPEVIALHLVNLWNGINVTQRAYPNNKKILDSMIKINLKILN